MLFNLDILRFRIGALNAEKVHDSALEYGEAGEPEKENVPHSNKGTRLDDLGAFKEKILVIIILDHHDHVRDHANGLQEVHAETNGTDNVALVRLDDHMLFRVQLFFRIVITNIIFSFSSRLFTITIALFLINTDG